MLPLVGIPKATLNKRGVILNFLIMKYLIFSLFCTLMVLSSCNDDIINEAPINRVSLEEFSQQNVSFFDARIRSISEEGYVRELYFANFSDEELRVENTFFDGIQYSDNGEGTDLEAHDGIFTSIDLFKHNERIQYDERNLIRSALEKPIVSPNFIQNEKLAELESNYKYRNLPNQVQTRTFEVTCDITFGGGGCNACDWWGGSWCDFCFELSNCSVTVGF